MPGLDFAEIEHRALDRRRDVGLHEEDAVPDIVDVLERLGLPVAVWPLGPDGPDGIFLRDGDHALIVLNSGVYLPRFRFTAAHELGHATYTDAPHLDLDATQASSFEEKRANAFAANFLVPTRALRVRCPGKTSEIDADLVLRLATEFGVSYPMLVYRLHNSGCITAQGRERLIGSSAALVRELLRGRPGNEVRLPAEFVTLASESYRRHEISFQRLSELLRRDANELAASLAGSGILHVGDEP